MTTAVAVEIPARMKHLPLDHAGRPVPWFATTRDDGQPELRVADGEKLARAVKERRCWVCGGVLGAYLAFPIGPMCTVNRVTSEPPCHRDCATYSARACPFLSRPNMRRRTTGLPDDIGTPGVMIDRNPGAVAVWVTRRYTPFNADHPDAANGGGVLFRLGQPTEVRWWAEGRRATRAEVEASLEGGLPLLREAADKDGPAAHAELDRALAKARRLLPAA